MGQLIAVVVFGLVAIGFGAAMFITSSMVRSALALVGAMAALGAIFLALESEFLGVLQLMMMASEMSIMAIFMVMYMHNPGGLFSMDMSHQKRRSGAAGVVAALAALSLAVVPAWGPVVMTAPEPARQLHDLGIELMGRSLLIFETASLAILIAMVAATAMAIAGKQK